MEASKPYIRFGCFFHVKGEGYGNIEYAFCHSLLPIHLMIPLYFLP